MAIKLKKKISNMELNCEKISVRYGKLVITFIAIK